MAKKDDTQETQPLPAIKPDNPESMIKAFADKVESLMNQAYHASQPAEGQQASEHHSKFADWANHLGDLWRNVKQHV